MNNESVQPYNGPVAVDLQPIASILIDLKPGMMRSLRSEQAGIVEVVEELKQNVATLGAKGSVSPDVYAHFVACTEKLDKLRVARALVDKLAEILEESEAFYEHEREADISIIADAVRSTARRRDDSIRTSFEKTLKYNSQAAEKAVKTRRKNAQAAAQGHGGEQAKPVVETPAPTP